MLAAALAAAKAAAPFVMKALPMIASMGGGGAQMGGIAPAFNSGPSTGVGGMGGIQPSMNNALGGLLSENLLKQSLSEIDGGKAEVIGDITSDELAPSDIPDGFKGLDNTGPQPFQLPGIPDGFKGIGGPMSGLSALSALGDAGFGGPLSGMVQDSLTQSSLADIDDGEEKRDMFGHLGGFMGGLDKGLQSPSQVLGLGLLSRYTNRNPGAMLAGLLGMGLLNDKGSFLGRKLQ